ALDLVAILESCSVRDAALKLQSWFSVPGAAQAAVQREQEPTAAKAAGQEPIAQLVSDENKERETDSFNKPLSFSLKSIDHSHPYARSRGITEQVAGRFGVGFFTGRGVFADRFTIPIHNRDGDLVAYAGRGLDARDPKYKFPLGSKKSLELFNLHRVVNV